MAFPNIFETKTVNALVARIEKIRPADRPDWGKMTAGQMLAHCCVPYEFGLEGSQPPTPGFVRFMLRLFVKKGVVSERPYAKNSGTAPQFIIRGDRDFEAEKARLIAFLRQAEGLGAAHFEQKIYPPFGPMSASEWNALYFKHLDHHLQQFGV